MSALTYGELFAGYGGLGMGVQSVLGGEMRWCAEFDKAPSRILATRYPHAPNLGDVTKVDWSKVEPVDVITGGSPCQDLSHAGKRLGMKAGTRSGLWASMCDAIDIIRPRLVVWENVRGALSAEADSALEPCAGCVGDGDDGPVLRALGRVLGDLAELGYDSWWYGLRAADVGAPHGRFRVFVFAVPAAYAERGGRDGWARDPLGLEVRRTAAAGSGEVAGERLTLLPTPEAKNCHAGPDYARMDREGSGGHDLVTAVSLLPTPRATDGTKGGPNQRGSSGDLMLPSAVNLLPTPRVTQAGYADDGRGGKSLDVEARSGANWGDYASAIARWETVLGRPAPDPTEPGRNGSPRLSPRFVEWMMGLPAGWVTDVDISRNEQLKALGNGVVPQQAAAATRAFCEDFTGMTKAVA